MEQGHWLKKASREEARKYALGRLDRLSKSAKLKRKESKLWHEKSLSDPSAECFSSIFQSARATDR